MENLITMSGHNWVADPYPISLLLPAPQDTIFKTTKKMQPQCMPQTSDTANRAENCKEFPTSK